MHLPITCLKRRWRAALLFTLCLLAFPHYMAASGFVEGTYNYMAYLSGTDQITIKVPVFDKDGYDTRGSFDVEGLDKDPDAEEIGGDEANVFSKSLWEE